MSKELTKADEALIQEEWYVSLLEDCKAVVVERYYNANDEILAGKWEVGKRISEENDNMERKKVYGKRIIENLSKDLKVSTSDLFNCVQFYKEYNAEEFDAIRGTLPEGKNITWYKMTNKYLGERKDKEKKVKTSFNINFVLDRLTEFLIDEMDMGEEDTKTAVKAFEKHVYDSLEE